MPDTPALAPHPDPDLFQAWLQREPRDCPNCAYRLEGLRDPVCPECGVALVLRVMPVSSRMGAFYTGLVGLASGVGFCVLLLLLLVIVSFVFRRPPSGPNGPLPAIAFCLVTGCVLAGVLWGWHTKRRQFRRLPTPARVGLALGAWLLSAGVLVLFLTTITLR